MDLQENFDEISDLYLLDWLTWQSAEIRKLTSLSKNRDVWRNVSDTNTKTKIFQLCLHVVTVDPNFILQK